MSLLLYSVIFTGQASLGTRVHLIHTSNDALAASPAGSDARAQEQLDHQSAAHAYTRHDVATYFIHLFIGYYPLLSPKRAGCMRIESLVSLRNNVSLPCCVLRSVARA